VRDSRLMQPAQFAIVVIILLLIERVPAHAAFVLEFADGRKMTVANYQEVGPTVKVYTVNGSFAFRKKDIVRIVSTEQQPSPALARPMTDAPLPAARSDESLHAPPSIVTRQTATHDALPLLPSWADLVDFAMVGVYRGRFFIGIFVGFKVLQFFLPATFH